jgi:hypothetical protein
MGKPIRGAEMIAKVVKCPICGQDNSFENEYGMCITPNCNTPLFNDLQTWDTQKVYQLMLQWGKSLPHSPADAIATSQEPQATIAHRQLLKDMQSLLIKYSFYTEEKPAQASFIQALAASGNRQPVAQPPQETSEFNPPVFDDPNLLGILEHYYRSSENWVKQEWAIDAAASEDSLGDNWLGRDRPVIFEERIGSYWITNAPDDYGYLLLNKTKFRFNENNLDSIHACFDFNQSESSHGIELDIFRLDLSAFRIIYPALVTRSLPDNQWRLERRGLIEFQPKSYAE